MFDEIAPDSEVDSTTMEAAEFPVATIALIAALAFCFVIEVALPIAAAPGPASLWMPATVRRVAGHGRVRP